MADDDGVDNELNLESLKALKRVFEVRCRHFNVHAAADLALLMQAAGCNTSVQPHRMHLIVSTVFTTGC